MTRIRYLPEAFEAIVEEPIFPGSRGKIRCHGVYYSAELDEGIHEILSVGLRVSMVATRDNIALVRP